MGNPHNFIENTSDSSATLYVKAYPNSKVNKIGGIFENEDGNKFLKIRVMEAPEDGKANRAIIKLLSKHLNISKSSFEIVSGSKNNLKTICVSGIKNGLENIFQSHF